ncbi:hypothetical protein BGZ61DRAFT_521356 [Ilyonectria robusta]|uniref:uncharacterized protein n=1 Tax=Ilyonectria robusta TaxID=1079257 RepID=UPI001E8E7AF1|nr:uncharacterized protein BGZ61DRAFT_521356 [Ilyonectria robusta]KAH8672354.1 hypothetical protein BGZ61DRAFT_521356 [Ilyonectria robusta]
MEITVRSDQRTKIDRNTLLKAMEPRVIGGTGLCLRIREKGGPTRRAGGRVLGEPQRVDDDQAKRAASREPTVCTHPLIHGIIMGGLFHARPALIARIWRLSLPLGLVDAGDNGDDPERP